MKYVTLSVFLVIPVMAQLRPGPIFGPPAFPPALQSYLELTPDQVNTIVRLNASVQQFQSEKLQRTAQVQVELVQETAKPNLDPMALGVRHLELEAIRREIQAQQQKTFAEIQNLLTAAQKSKVQSLIEAMRLQSVICDAQAQNIIPSALPGNVIPSNRLLPGTTQGFASFLLGGLSLPGVGCTPGFRTGNFFAFLPSGEQPQSARQ